MSHPAKFQMFPPPPMKDKKKKKKKERKKEKSQLSEFTLAFQAFPAVVDFYSQYNSIYKILMGPTQ